jgi:D-alanyl-D-alanine carboxypeptidase
VTRPIAHLFATLIAFLLAAGSAAAIETPYLVADMDSGKVLSERNAHQLWYPASVTKLMNAYVTFKALREGKITLQTEVVVTPEALAEPPSKMGFKVGTVIDLDNALKMMLVHSSNDIAVAVGETVGGSEAHFVDMMNAEAARLGMSSTHFVNPNGLPGPGQATTARDLAVLAHALWTEFPERRPLFQISAIRSGKKVMKSANSLLERYRGTVGMKTGFICSSGFNIVAVASRNGRTLIAVVLGSDTAKDRAELTARLMNDGFGKPFSLTPRPTLASFRGTSPVPYAIDMRDDVCGKKNKGENEDDAAAGQPFASALDPRFKLMEPVVVTTLGRRTPAGGVQSASTDPSAADAPAAKPAKPVKKKVVKKKAAKPDVATGDGPAVPTLVDTNAAAPAAAPSKKAGKASKIEIGVPFDSTDIAPLPDVPAPATQ